MSARDSIASNSQSPPSAPEPQTFKPISDTGLPSPEFCGPSSSEFTLNVVSGNLKAMGMPTAILDKPVSGLPSSSSSQIAPYGPFMKLLTMDPLWNLRKDDALDLIEKWFDGLGSMYPIVTRERMLETAENVFRSLERAQSDGLKPGRGFPVETLLNDETNKLKIVCAISRTLESGGRNDQAERLFQSTTEAVEGLLWNSNDVNGIQLLALVSLYQYHLDEEGRAGRIAGFAARLCLEMGLHRRVMLENTFPNPEERMEALRTFWCVYMLERRTSLGLGIPFSILDSYIDPSLFTLHDFDPVVSILVEWTMLAGKTWQALNSHGEKGAEIRTHDLDYLDYQIIQWYELIPSNLKLNWSWLHQNGGPPASKHIQAFLYMRKYHLRNLIYRPVLQSATRIQQHERYAQAAVKIAKETLQTLADLNDTTLFLRNHPLFFKHPLLTAFGNLLLAVVNASSKFWNSAKPEFDIALNLIKLLSTRSAPLMRLWKRLQGLHELQTTLLHSVAESSNEAGSFAPVSNSSDALSFEELFPSLPATGTPLRASDSPVNLNGAPMIRDHVNSLFDATAGPGSFFDFPFFEWQ